MLLSLTLILQVRSGAYGSDFGGHSDEAAHVVTGLMVRDYLAGPVWQGTHPMRFAEEYYSRFPKVAIGHYPPGYYLVEGLWLLPSRTGTAALLLPAFLTSLAALTIFIASRCLMRFPAAIAASILFPLMHLVQTYTAIVMSDMLLVILCLLATLAFSRFLATGGARWSLAFGLMAAAAILTTVAGIGSPAGNHAYGTLACPVGTETVACTASCASPCGSLAGYDRTYHGGGDVRGSSR